MFKDDLIKPVTFDDEVYPEELKTVRKRLILQEGQTIQRGDGLPDFKKHISLETSSNALKQVIDELHDTANEAAWDSDQDAKHKGLVGLAFSGGGIRSATFNLGIMQALKKIGLFRCVDYLSTVSGGGYIGSCISSTLASIEKAPGKTKASEIPPETLPEDAPKEAEIPPEPLNEIFGHEQGKLEPKVFRHLRDNANYLAPNGLRDVLRIPAILLRGIVVNFLVILPYLLAAALFTIWIKPTGKKLETPFLSNWFGGALGDSFVTTKLLLILLVLFFALYPGIHMMGQKWKTEKSSNWELRNEFGRFLGLCLAVIGVVAFIELQPIAIKFVHDLRDKGWASIDALMTGSGALGVIVTAFADKLLPKVSKLSGKLAFYAIGALGFIFIWLVYLFLCEKGIDWTAAETTENWWESTPKHIGLYGFPAVIIWLYTLATVDVNFTGIHKFYRDRLSKAYIVCLKKPRKSDTGKDRVQDGRIMLSEYDVEHRDNVPLSSLNTERGPYHLINTLLNLKRTSQRYRSGRRGDFFLFSKLFIGGEITGYSTTKDMERTSRQIDLATAMAISGAAAAPNMGKMTFKPLVFILAMLNVRLNYWLPNPARLARKYKHLPGGFARRVGPVYLLMEMFGWNTAKSKYINLSDGGHIENLGIYELVRRQCRLIIAGDGEADAELNFNGLADVIRMIQIDMGIKIEISGLDELRRGEQHHAIGTIHYPNKRIGKLIYLKSSLLGDNNLKATLDKENYTTSPYRDDNLLFDDGAYIAHYKAKHPAFPHESTGDQFFDEAQFECYRALGYNVAINTLQSWDQTPHQDTD